jgi:uncharacterized protein YcbK (DUF882 family)
MKKRDFLKTGIVFGSLLPTPLLAGINDPNSFKTIRLNNQNTQERISVTFWRNGWFDHNAFEEIEYFFRDWRENATHKIDPYLIDLLYNIAEESRGDKEIVMLSGYRTPKTNKWLENHPRYRAAKNSLHMFGRAADFTLPSARLHNIKNYARSLRVGGVGYYPRKHFIHVDTGKLRYWRS